MAGEDVKAALVRHAALLLDEQGLAGFTGREVARRAGVSHGAPRRYFPTLAALLSAVAATGFADLRSRMPAPTASMPAPTARGGDEAEHHRVDPRAALLALAQAYVAFAQERPAMFELMFRHDLLEGSGERLREHSTPIFGAAVELVALTGVREPGLTALDLWAGVHGLAVLASRRALALMTDEEPGALLERQIQAHLPT
ncbi:WHG domain-containing protein [Actinoplanes sp. LDG1-06]|uniref:WHG domain-containing protein n=1 Tax=Paractinoplanes ovalisporus TaxID=2810368 RepID=A0ABS2A6F2_9ACTN|nr:TetR/AcrR family transcriptional regulator [Actinoplanes ovalisporus]MBM2615434.1 WHG domain-containing protein [Actinoplanes ovalisporus]